MSAIQPELETLGVGLAFVGIGDVDYARDFQKTQKLESPLYIAADLNAYRALNFRKGIASTFSPAAMAHGLRAMSEGYRQGATAGDPWQQGGVLLLRADGTAAWVYRSNEAGDHPALDVLVAEARKVAGH